MQFGHAVAETWPAHTLLRVKLHHRAKFHADQSNRCGYMPFFKFFKNCGRPPPCIFKIGNFNCQHGSEGQYATSCQISCISVKPLRRYGRFPIVTDFLTMASFCHVEFLKVQNFNYPYSSQGQCASSSQISCRSVKSLRGYGSFSIFQIGGRPSSWIFKIWKF